MSYVNAGQVQTFDLAANSVKEVQMQYDQYIYSFENANKANSAVTFAWFYDSAFKSDMHPGHPKMAISVDPVAKEDPYYPTLSPVLSAVGGIKLLQNKEYKARFIVLPYRLNDMIDTELGRMQVKDYVLKLGYPESGTTIDMARAENAGLPGYTNGTFMSSVAANEIAIGLQNGVAYGANQSISKLIWNPYGNLGGIKRVEFDYEANMDNNQVSAFVTWPGSLKAYEINKYGATSGHVVLEEPLSPYFQISFATKNAFTFTSPTWQWFFKVKNLKFFYYGNNNFPSPTNPPAPTATPTATSVPCNKSIGDANCDGLINLTDFERFRQEYTGTLTTKTADFTGDGKITLMDFETWRRNFK